MKRQEIGNPKVNLSWFIEEDGYTKNNNFTILNSEKGKKQLVDTILMLLDQGMEIRIGTDGMCLILEANDADDDYTNASYQYIDDEHYIESYNHTYEDAALDEAKNMSDEEIIEEVGRRG